MTSQCAAWPNVSGVQVRKVNTEGAVIWSFEKAFMLISHLGASSYRPLHIYNTLVHSTIQSIHCYRTCFGFFLARTNKHTWCLGGIEVGSHSHHRRAALEFCSAPGWVCCVLICINNRTKQEIKLEFDLNALKSAGVKTPLVTWKRKFQTYRMRAVCEKLHSCWFHRNQENK